jgi:hypothetical protein
MVSFRRIAFLLAFALPALIAAKAQSTSSSSTPDASAGQAQDQAQGQGQATQPQTMSVQARIKARREKRRADAIHEAYGHLYDAYAGFGYLRFTLPSPLQRVNETAWNVGLTRYRSDRLGITVDGRGIYGSAYVYNNATNIWQPGISEYAAQMGPMYRFYFQPKYSVSGRVMGGFAYGNFTGGTSGNPDVSSTLHLYPNGYTYALSASVIGEYNLAPQMSIRVAPEYFATGFGSALQNNLGFTAGISYRWGKQ